MGLGQLVSCALDKMSLMGKSGILKMPDRQVETGVWHSRRSVGWQQSRKGMHSESRWSTWHGKDFT